MAKEAYVGVSNSKRKIKEIYVGVSGKPRKVKAGYVGVSNKPRQFWSGGLVLYEAGDSSLREGYSIDVGRGTLTYESNRINMIRSIQYAYMDNGLYIKPTIDFSKWSKVNITICAATAGLYGGYTPHPSNVWIGPAGHYQYAEDVKAEVKYTPTTINDQLKLTIDVSSVTGSYNICFDGNQAGNNIYIYYLSLE